MSKVINHIPEKTAFSEATEKFVKIDVTANVDVTEFAKWVEEYAASRVREALDRVEKANMIDHARTTDIVFRVDEEIAVIRKELEKGGS